MMSPFISRGTILHYHHGSRSQKTILTVLYNSIIVVYMEPLGKQRCDGVQPGKATASSPGNPKPLSPES